ncbi:MAG: hypothetical protein DI543_21380 [Bradyrhizobium icense]|nr:MAG: hypothetical protein DI543_21380 [Bradyrhizobium icense]
MVARAASIADGATKKNAEARAARETRRTYFIIDDYPNFFGRELNALSNAANAIFNLNNLQADHVNLSAV